MRAIEIGGIRRFFLCLATAAATLIGTAAITDTAAEAATRKEIKRIVVEEALQTNIPPSLALAVAKVESNFNAKAESSAGARGVMQIMPRTGRDLYGVKAEELWDARLNVKLGIDYLESLIERYGGRWDLALSHYNGGSKVGSPPNARVIPATRKYVKSVLGWQRKYERNAIVVAMTEEIARSNADSAPAPARVAGEVTQYWMFDKPDIDRNWRDYLKIADHWLNRPTRNAQQATPANEAPQVAEVVEPAEAAETPPQQELASTVEETKPSHRFKQSIEERRARFRRHLATGEKPWTSRRGHLFGENGRVAPWATVNG